MNINDNEINSHGKFPHSCGEEGDFFVPVRLQVSVCHISETC